MSDVTSFERISSLLYQYLIELCSRRLKNLGFVFKEIKYSEFNWKICEDLKILGLVLGQQSGFTATMQFHAQKTKNYPEIR